jgi:hypothetical protein
LRKAEIAMVLVVPSGIAHLPMATLAEMLNGVDAPDDCEEENNSFFGFNPYCGDRVM